MLADMIVRITTYASPKGALHVPVSRVWGGHRPVGRVRPVRREEALSTSVSVAEGPESRVNTPTDGPSNVEAAGDSSEASPTEPTSPSRTAMIEGDRSMDGDTIDETLNMDGATTVAVGPPPPPSSPGGTSWGDTSWGLGVCGGFHFFFHLFRFTTRTLCRSGY